MLSTIAASDEPKITDWMQGWSGIAGVVVGLLAAIFTGLLLVYEIRTGRRLAREAAQERAEAAQDREFARAERRDAQAQQARTVAISDVQVASSGEGEIRRVLLKVANYSNGPVLDVSVELLVNDGEIRVPLGTQAAVGPQEVMRIDALPRLTSADLAPMGLTGQALLDALSAEVAFTDMAGIRWKRRDSRQPERIID